MSTDGVGEKEEEKSMALAIPHYSCSSGEALTLGRITGLIEKQFRVSLPADADAMKSPIQRRWGVCVCSEKDTEPRLVIIDMRHSKYSLPNDFHWLSLGGIREVAQLIAGREIPTDDNAITLEPLPDGKIRVRVGTGAHIKSDIV